jgi:hypothetical protein
MATHHGVGKAAAPRARREYWQRQVEAQGRSGLSQAAFCRRRGLRTGTFSFWKWKFAHEARGRPRRAAAVRRAEPPTFVPIQLAPEPVGLRPTPVGEVEIALGPRRCVRVRGPVEPGWLTTGLRAVEALGC